MNKSAPKMDASATYRIHIQGLLDTSWSDRLGGLAIQTEQESDQVPVTKLYGRLLDQAALFGVLNTLYNMHYPLLLVEYVVDNNPANEYLPNEKFSN